MSAATEECGVCVGDRLGTTVRAASSNLMARAHGA